MNENRVVLGLVGSPNKSGRTNELVNATLEVLVALVPPPN